MWNKFWSWAYPSLVTSFHVPCSARHPIWFPSGTKSAEKLDFYLFLSYHNGKHHEQKFKWDLNWIIVYWIWAHTYAIWQYGSHREEHKMRFSLFSCNWARIIAHLGRRSADVFPQVIKVIIKSPINRTLSLMMRYESRNFQ